MPEEAGISTEVICTLITVAGTVLSALIAFFVSRSTANKELEKMKMTWEREDVVSSDDEFADMSGAVAKFIGSTSYSNRQTAMEKVASVRSKETGDLGNLLDSLFAAIKSGGTQEANDCLTKVIDKKRDSKSKGNASKGKKPKK